MRPYLETDATEPAVAIKTIAASASETIVSVWAPFGRSLGGVWIEIVFVLAAMCIYFWHSSRSREKSRKASKRTRHRPASGWGSKKEITSTECAMMNGLSKGSENQFQKLVVGLLHRGAKNNPIGLLIQYEELVKDGRVSVRRHIPDEQNARSMYVGLIECAAALPVTAQTPSFSSQRASVGVSAAWRWIEYLLTDMRTFGFLRTVEFYSTVLKMLVGADLFQESLAIHVEMTKDSVVPSNVMFVSFLNVAVNCNEWTKALEFFEQVARSGPPSVRTIMTVLRVYSKSKNWRGGAELLERMDSLGTPPDNLVLNNVLGLCISAGELDGAQQVLQRWKDIIDVISCNIILKGCAQQGNLTKASALLSRMVSSGPAPNLISYNTVMDCAVRCMQIMYAEKPSGRNLREGVSADAGDGSPALSSALAEVKRRPWDLLDELISKGLEPDRYTCSTLVKGMHLSGCSASEIDKAVELLRRIGASALQIPGAGSSNSSGANARLLEVLFNTLLDACISVRDLDRMADIFDMMQEFQITVSAVTYGTLIKAFGQAGRITRCHEVWGDLRRARIQPTIVTYGCYIDACIRNNEIDAAEQIFDSMSQGLHVVRPNAVIYTSLIRGFAQTNQPKKALEFYRRMRQEGIEATNVTFNSLLDVVSRQLSAPDMMQEVIDDMCKANITPDVVTYSILMRASCNAGNVQNALSLFRQIQKRGLVFDQVAFNTLLLACSKAEQLADAEDIFQEMLRAGMLPTPVTTSIMVKMYGRAKMLDKAVAVSDLLETEYGQKPNLFVYTCLIQACVQNKQVRRSWDTFNKMMDSGVEPDAVTYGTVIHGCVYLNKFQYAMSLVRRAYMKPPGKDEADNPFGRMAPLETPVRLQPEVMHMLLSALKRKEQIPLVVELEEIMLEFNVSNAEKPQGKNRRTHHAGFVTAFNDAFH